MKRRKFMKIVGEASAAALFLEATVVNKTYANLGQNIFEDIFDFFDKKKANGYKLFTQAEVNTLRKVLTGLIPVSLREAIREKDPNTDLVAMIENYSLPQGKAYILNIKTIIGALELLPPMVNVIKFPLPLSSVGDEQVEKFFLELENHAIPAFRNIFRGAKIIGMQPVYVNELVTWKEMAYHGPWLRDVSKPDEELERTTSFELAAEMEERLASLRAAVIPHDKLRESLKVADIISEDPGLVLRTDVLVIGTGPGGSTAASELAKAGKHRVLVVEKGDFVEPNRFLQREQLMVPKVYMDVELSATEVLGKPIPNLNSAVVRGRLVGGSATINHALFFDPPKPVIKEWNETHGIPLTYSDLEPHMNYMKTLLKGDIVPEVQINRNNDLIRVGIEKLTAQGYRHHYHYGRAPRNVFQCRGCGFCDMGCRYNRKQTPLNTLMPLATKNGAQIIANCEVLKLNFSQGSFEGGRILKIESVDAVLLDPVDRSVKKTVKIIAEKIVLSAGTIASSRILLASGLNEHRESKKNAAPSVGTRFSCHAPLTFYGEFDEAVFASSAGPPMSYFLTKYMTDGEPNPDIHHVSWKIEGIFNHPMVMAQLMPFESSEKHWELMKRFNNIMTVALLFRDAPSGQIREKSISYKVPAEDKPRYLEALRESARIIFAAGAKRFFTGHTQPLILNSTEEIESKLTLDILADDHLMVTSGHPMGGNPFGDNPKNDVVDPFGETWDVKDLFVIDGSILPGSPGTNPTLTILTYCKALMAGLLESQKL